MSVQEMPIAHPAGLRLRSALGIGGAIAKPSKGIAQPKSMD
jgi:hypothetical protein